MDLFRAMTPAADGRPTVGRSARWLGVRTPADATTPDVAAVLPTDSVAPGSGGLSVAPADP